MKAPICGICLNSGILCSSCQGRLDSGEITEREIEVSRSIMKLSSRIKILREAEIRKVVETENALVLIAAEGTADKLVGKGGIAVRWMTEEFGKRVKVVEESRDFRAFVQELLFPVPVLTVNVLHTPRGETLRVVIPRGKKPSISPREIGKIAETVFGKSVEIVSGRR